MPIERRGSIARLTESVFHFLEGELGGISLDESGIKERRPDYTCLRGLLVVEVKTLETDPGERLENVIRPETQREDWPKFYGSWPLSSVLKNLADGEDFQRRLTDRLGRAIRDHIKKANDQLREHGEREKRRNLTRLMILLNEDHEEYTPDVVRFAAGRELWRTREDGLLRNAHIDAIIYLSHRHAAAIDGQVALPVAVIEGGHLDTTPWKRNVIDLVVRRWCHWNNIPLNESLEVAFGQFEAVEHIPERVKRHELWKLQYRRKPYMTNWRDDDLRNLWDVTILISLLAFTKDPPMIVPKAGGRETMERFTHLLQEISVRGLSLDFFKPEAQRLRVTIDSLPYGETVRSWLRHELRHIIG